MMKSVTELPFNAFLGLESVDESSGADELVRLPAGGHYLNHLGTVHASALLALAEAASGEFLLREVGVQEGMVPVVRRLESKFRKPANGPVTAKATASPQTLDELAPALERKGRALIPIQVELYDESGTHVLSATVDWFLAKV